MHVHGYADTGSPDGDLRGVTRQDILASRIEECECDAIELRCQGLHTEAIAKLEDALSMSNRLYGVDTSDTTIRLCKQVAMACNASAAALMGSGDMRRAMDVLNHANRAMSKAPENDMERIQLQAATHRMVTQIRQVLPQTSRRRRNPPCRRSITSSVPPSRLSAPRNTCTAAKPINKPVMNKPVMNKPVNIIPAVQESLSSCIVSSPCKLQPKGRPTLIIYDTNNVTSGQRRALQRLSRPMEEVYTHVRLMVQYQADQERQRREFDEGGEMTEELWLQMKAYFELQRQLEEEFIKTLDGPAVACGLSPQQLAELQTRELNPEDYDMLLMLDEQIQKPTLELEKVTGYQSRPVTPSKLGSSCQICLADMELGEVMKILPCGHEFHKECIVKWLTECKDTCPMTCKLKADDGE